MSGPWSASQPEWPCKDTIAPEDPAEGLGCGAPQGAARHQILPVGRECETGGGGGRRGVLLAAALPWHPNYCDDQPLPTVG